MDSLPLEASSDMRDSTVEERGLSCLRIAESLPLFVGSDVGNSNDTSSACSELDELWKIVKKLQGENTSDGVKSSVQDVDGPDILRKVEGSSQENEAAVMKRNVLTMSEESKSVLVRSNCQEESEITITDIFIILDGHKSRSSTPEIVMLEAEPSVLHLSILQCLKKTSFQVIINRSRIPQGRIILSPWVPGRPLP
jgi:hypothetical protein